MEDLENKKIDWGNDEVLAVLNDNTLSLKRKSEMIGVSLWFLCRKMKGLGIKHNRYWRTGLDRPATNKEIKARYNAKRKAIGWKYLYQVK